jgi:hypothetical protein
MRAARKKKRAVTLGQVIKAHVRARERQARLVNKASQFVHIPEPLDRAVNNAHDAAADALSALCRYRPRDADGLVKWLSAVLADEEVTGESIRVLDGLAALSSAHNSLCRLLVPANEMHSR